MANVNQCFKIKDDFLFKDFLTDSLVFNQVKDISSILNSLKNFFLTLYSLFFDSFSGLIGSLIILPGNKLGHNKTADCMEISVRNAPDILS